MGLGGATLTASLLFKRLSWIHLLYHHRSISPTLPRLGGSGPTHPDPPWVCHCSSAIKRAHQAMSSFGPSLDYLRHGSLLLEICNIVAARNTSCTVTSGTQEAPAYVDGWWLGDPHGRQNCRHCTAPATQVFTCDSTKVHAAITPPGTWQWMNGQQPFHGSLQKLAQNHQFQQYKKKRDIKRIYANEPSHWTRHCSSLMATLTKTKRFFTRHKGRQKKHIFDWMAHTFNLAKGVLYEAHRASFLCKFCGEPETQQHINVDCQYSPLIETRLVYGKCIDDFYLSYRHHHLLQKNRWIIPLLDYMEEHVWCCHSACSPHSLKATKMKLFSNQTSRGH
jgi:hypothetical protein